MPNLKDYNPILQGLAIDVVGPPKTGKSDFARRMALRILAEGRRVALVVSPAAEYASYAGLDIPESHHLLALDKDWDPEQGAAGLKAGAWKDVKAKVAEWERDDALGLLIFDTFNTAVGDPLWHFVLKERGVFDPHDLSNSRAPYVSFAAHLEPFLQRLDLFRFKKKCHVLRLWHEDIKEAEGVGVPRKETVKEGGQEKTVVRWDSARLPKLYGGMRQDILKFSDLGFFSEAVVGSNPFRCRLVCIPDQGRQAGSRLDLMHEFQSFKGLDRQGRALPQGEVPNDWEALLKIVEAKYGKGTTK